MISVCQDLANGMAAVSASSSIVALHLPCTLVHEWKNAFEDTQKWKMVTTPIVITQKSAKHVRWSYHHRWSPVNISHTFYIFHRTRVSGIFCNSMYLLQKGDVNWRRMWQSCVVIQSTMVPKSERVKKRSAEATGKRVKKDTVSTEESKQDPSADSKEEDKDDTGSDDEVQLPLPDDLDDDTRAQMKKDAKTKHKKKQKFFRREQIARSVLRHIIKMFARVGEAQVHCDTN